MFSFPPLRYTFYSHWTTVWTHAQVAVAEADQLTESAPSTEDPIRRQKGKDIGRFGRQLHRLLHQQVEN